MTTSDRTAEAVVAQPLTGAALDAIHDGLVAVSALRDLAAELPRIVTEGAEDLAERLCRALKLAGEPCPLVVDPTGGLHTEPGVWVSPTDPAGPAPTQEAGWVAPHIGWCPPSP